MGKTSFIFIGVVMILLADSTKEEPVQQAVMNGNSEEQLSALHDKLEEND